MDYLILLQAKRIVNVTKRHPTIEITIDTTEAPTCGEYLVTWFSALEKSSLLTQKT